MSSLWAASLPWRPPSGTVALPQGGTEASWLCDNKMGATSAVALRRGRDKVADSLILRVSWSRPEPFASLAALPVLLPATALPPRLSARLLPLQPVVFDASKLSTSLVCEEGQFRGSPADAACPSQLLPRCYTLTHNDVSGELRLSIGARANKQQLSGWYTRLLRDEVVAKWHGNGPDGSRLSLHVHCHVSGGHHFLAPAALRDWIFRREMPLVLRAVLHGDRDLFSAHPALEHATVWAHFHSSDPAFDRADCLGPLRCAASSASTLPPDLTFPATSASSLPPDLTFPATSASSLPSDLTALSDSLPGDPLPSTFLLSSSAVDAFSLAGEARELAQWEGDLPRVQLEEAEEEPRIISVRSSVSDRGDCGAAVPALERRLVDSK